jgi:hypothetical protein
MDESEDTLLKQLFIADADGTLLNPSGLSNV